jgi:UDPglucose--hexose-1-phosphate uridylyltransferase
VRVVPNLYPAFERQEVVIHAPEHVRSFADLEDRQLPLVAQAWRERSRAMAAEGAGQAHAFVNEGRLAGASLAHSHSQLVALPGLSPAEEAEQQDRLPELFEHDELVVAELDGVVALAHPFAAGPLECLIAPREPTPEALDDAGFLIASLRLLQRLVRALRAAEGPRPWNAWFHSGLHAHAHFVPRLTALAGLELGAGIYVNPLPPEQAAAALRAAPAKPASSR